MSDVITTRLRLRPFTLDDAEPLARLYSDDVVMRFMVGGEGLSRDTAIARARANITNFNDQWRTRDCGVWAVVDRQDGRLLGQCGLRHIPEIDQTEILYMLNKTVWGRGLGTEAAAAALAFATGARGMRRIIGLVHFENRASRRVLEKCGLVYEREESLWGLQLAWYGLDAKLQTRIAA